MSVEEGRQPGSAHSRDPQLPLGTPLLGAPKGGQLAGSTRTLLAPPVTAWCMASLSVFPIEIFQITIPPDFNMLSTASASDELALR